MVLLMPFTWTCTPPFVERHCMCKSLVEIAPSQNGMLCCVKGVKIQHQAVPYVMPDMSLQKQWGVSMATCKLAMNSLPTFNPKLLPCFQYVAIRSCPVVSTSLPGFFSGRALRTLGLSVAFWSTSGRPGDVPRWTQAAPSKGRKAPMGGDLGWGQLCLCQHILRFIVTCSNPIFRYAYDMRMICVYIIYRLYTQ